MKLSEFKAFIEGLEHGFSWGAPTQEQWELVKKKLEEVEEGFALPKVNRGPLDGGSMWYSEVAIPAGTNKSH